MKHRWPTRGSTCAAELDDTKLSQIALQRQRADAMVDDDAQAMTGTGTFVP